MRHAVILSTVLAAVWLAWSGHFDSLMLTLGAGSLVFVVALSLQLGVVDDESVPIRIRYRRLFLYIPWLAWEIVKANLDVARRIVTPGPLQISPRILRVPSIATSELVQVVYANSITLTPGTVTIDIADGEVLVHALHADAAAGVESGDMARRCQALEGRPQ